MATTYTPIATNTLGANTTSFTFSSIPSTYQDLILIMSAISSTNTIYNAFARPDNNSSAIYERMVVYGTGSAAAGVAVGVNSAGMYIGDSAASGTNAPTVNITHFSNYSGTAVEKTAISYNSNQGDGTATTISNMANTSSYSSLTIYSTGTFGTGSVFTLYGLATA